MRNLTINRKKSFVACLMTLKIYIEDHAAGEMTINSIPCRKIGEIKNGEEKTFQIAENPAKVFVIADKLSKDYCNDYYELAGGQEDIFLSGVNKFNPANGNAFRFDNNNSEVVSANRKKGTRKGLAVLIVALIIGAIVGFFIANSLTGFILSGLSSSPTPQAASFSADSMSIILTDAFRETEAENYTVAYDSQDVAVFALKEPFSLADGIENYTIEQYGHLVIKNNGLDSAELETDGKLTGFRYEYTNPETNDTYQFFSYVYKADDAFWLIQFATLRENAEEYSQQISQWAESVTFSAES